MEINVEETKLIIIKIIIISRQTSPIQIMRYKNNRSMWNMIIA